MNTINEIKNALQRTNGRLEDTEEQISDLEVVESTQAEEQKKQK